jgi:DNA polymerase-4
MAACPQLCLVTADPAKYSHACGELHAIWRDFTPLVEMFSIDEAFLDVTGCEKLLGDPLQIAIQIKERIWMEQGLTCSIGIAPNKLLAKLGSDLQKPDGIVLISPEDINAVLENLPVRELCGIGPSLTRSLAVMGIRTCGELGRACPRVLAGHFGVMGQRLREMGRGIDTELVVPLEQQQAEESKSIGHSMTLAEDCSDSTSIERHILQLSEKVGRRLRRGMYSGRTVTLTLRYANFHTFSKQRRLRHAIDHGLEIHAATVGILREVDLQQPIRLVGVSVSHLEKNALQMALFDDDRKRKTTALVMDDINDRYGDFTVTWGTLADRCEHEKVISPAWRPGGDRQY